MNVHSYNDMQPEPFGTALIPLTNPHHQPSPTITSNRKTTPHMTLPLSLIIYYIYIIDIYNIHHNTSSYRLCWSRFINGG